MSGAIIDFWEARARPVLDWIETGFPQDNQPHRKDQAVQCSLYSSFPSTAALDNAAAHHELPHIVATGAKSVSPGGAVTHFI